MSIDAYITIGVIIVAFVLFTLNYFSVDHVALGIMATLALTGVLSAQESVQGFSNRATLTVAAMFVLGDALIKTGFIESVSPWFTRLFQKGYKISILGLSALVGSISAFINNTPVVATFIPLVTHSTRKTNRNPSRYLIPLSFGAIFGGTCTLIGTSTNLLVDGIAREQGLEGFSMFTFAPLGLVFFVVGTVYLMLFSKRLLPVNQNLKDFEQDKNVKDYLAEIKVMSRLNEYEEGESKADEKITIEQIFEGDDQAQVERVFREDNLKENPSSDFALERGDTLLVRGSMERIKKILKNEMLQLSESITNRKFPEEATNMVEIIILPNSRLINQKLDDIDFFQRYRSRVLAIRQRGKQKFNNLGDIKLKVGDVLLLQATEEGYNILNKAERRRKAPFLSLSESGIEKVDRKNLFILGGILAAVIALASLNIVPILVGALAGIFILVLLRIIKMEQAYRAIDWKVIILLAGALSLGAAMEKTGLSTQLAELLENIVAQRFGPMAVVAAIYLITSIFTEIMSNNAAAALLAPVAISIAQSLQLDATPFLLAITFAGSASFMTPVGYQTNTMVYSAGKYDFSDFTKIGMPLNLLFWILATLLIPVFYPF